MERGQLATKRSQYQNIVLSERSQTEVTHYDSMNAKSQEVQSNLCNRELTSRCLGWGGWGSRKDDDKGAQDPSANHTVVYLFTMLMVVMDSQVHTHVTRIELYTLSAAYCMSITCQ